MNVNASNPIHRPCPDILPDIQPGVAEKGLSKIAAIRQGLKEQELKRLRVDYGLAKTRLRQEQIKRKAKQVENMWG